MKKIFIFLIIQLFQFSFNQTDKELPIYGVVDSVNKEKIFLKTNLFKPEKDITFLVRGRVYGGNPFRSPALNLNYCFSKEKNESCTYTEAKDWRVTHSGADGLYYNYYYTATIKMKNYYNFLLFTINIQKADSVRIEHDPNSDVTAKEFSQSTLFSEGSTLFLDAKSTKKGIKFNVALTTNSSKNYENLTIFYENSHYKNKEFTEYLGKSVVTNYFKKTDTSTEFYFSLPVYNYSKEIIEYRYLIFRPENKTGNFRVREIKYDVKALPKYGQLTLEDKTHLDAFYLNIEDFKEGDNIYLQTITSTYNYDSNIYYNFADTNYDEDFSSLENTERSKNKYSSEKEKEYKYYFSIEKKENKKYLLFQVDYDHAAKFTIKNTEKNEYTNITLIIIIASVSAAAILGIVIGIICYIKRCQNKIRPEIDEKQSDSPLVDSGV